MAFVNLPPGSFYMGSCMYSPAQQFEDQRRDFMGETTAGVPCPSGAGVDGDADAIETPQHLVRITKGFQMGMHEVTLGQFKKYIADTGRRHLLTNDFMEANGQGDQAAVADVSWRTAQDLVAWLNRKEGGESYRLPTEAEWEYAARAGTSTRYFFGDSSAITHLGEHAWYRKNSVDVGENHVHPVGLKRPNPWGLYDTYGNVEEWVQDRYAENSYAHSPTEDPVGPLEGESRVLRGGGFTDFPSGCRSASRRSGPVGGFRLVRQASPSDNHPLGSAAGATEERVEVFEGRPRK
ncbi:MAG: formylglycine-generating enzyme family protein [Gammaproteobacteria bacterium]|nr:formylglycine-generating enzyme family protein [Gammaproteobacteria bacterium]MBU1655046.1 formylglycine-generating enzyme family protein [Gammaproteobacteria bacterium]MBU1961543.1 formylglycine-generating enzyme family protein [Gammaproteobacteria bacterium]